MSRSTSRAASLPTARGGLRFVQRAGEGGAGSVYRVQRADGVYCAAKLFEDAELAAHEERILRRVARSWGPRLLGRGTASVPGGGEQAFLLTDWVDGSELATMGAPSDPAVRLWELWCILHGVGRGLEEIHQAGFRHGDVKPANVMWREGLLADSPEGALAVLIDVGLSAEPEQEVRGYTPHFAAPELREGKPSFASDVYALGLLVRERLAEGDTELRDFAPLLEVLAMMEQADPGARPHAAWVAERARRALGLLTTDDERRRRHEQRVVRAYFAVRGRDLELPFSLLPDYQGAPREWLADLAEPGLNNTLGELGPWQKLRWLEMARGIVVDRLPPAWRTDAALADALLEAGPEERLAIGTSRTVQNTGSPLDWLSDALQLDAHVDDLEAQGAAVPTPLRVAVAERLMLQGELGRALGLARAVGAPARVVLAETLRRMGDTTAAAAALAGSDDSQARALKARLAWDTGQLDLARNFVIGAHDPRAAEVRALLAYSAGAYDEGLRIAEDAAVFASNTLERARLFGTRALLHHARGAAESSLQDFAEAERLAVSAGAALEAASFATGIASASSDAGRLDAVLASSTRAALGWERLGQPARAARALLARANALVLLGASFEALEASSAAIDAAARSFDKAATLYAELALLEARGLGRGDDYPRAFDLAAVVGDSSLVAGEARLRVVARLLAWPELARRFDKANLDRDAERASAPTRWDWWGHRVAYAEADEVLSLTPKLDALIGEPGPVDARLHAARSAAESLGRAGDEVQARAWALRAAEIVRSLSPHVPAEYRASFAVRHGHGEGEERPKRFDKEQWLQLERLATLLDGISSPQKVATQVLDVLLVWTGAERAVLLVREGTELVPRSGRNLAGLDVSMDEIRLSRSMAERALSSGEVVIAHDALHTVEEQIRSVHALRLRSILVIPLLARGKSFGVVYLDDRARSMAFRDLDLGWMRFVAQQVAHVLAEVEERRALEKALRRAERAEAKLERRVEEGEREILSLREALSGEREHATIRGQSAPIRALQRAIERVARSAVPVLVVGESGTGKELVARALHDESERAKQRFVSENCAALPESLLESTLFGHVKGSFTGATSARVGLFEMADGGTLFLDEVGEMSLGMQAKLLRILETGELRPVGSERTRHVDVRVVAATHRDLAAMVKSGQFREDLFFRLDVISLAVPPLRERADDIPLLVAHFLEKHAEGRSIPITQRAMDRLMSFEWPGNVRQLENEVRKLAVFAEERIDENDLSEALRRGGRTHNSTPASRARVDESVTLRARMDALEAELVSDALERTSWNRSRAAEMLGISRFGLQKMIRRLGIGPRDEQN